MMWESWAEEFPKSLLFSVSERLHFGIICVENSVHVEKSIS
jgi:hypothetical protein